MFSFSRSGDGGDETSGDDDGASATGSRTSNGSALVFPKINDDAAMAKSESVMKEEKILTRSGHAKKESTGASATAIKTQSTNNRRSSFSSKSEAPNTINGKKRENTKQGSDTSNKPETKRARGPTSSSSGSSSSSSTESTSTGRRSTRVNKGKM
jgi:hypothetical protein